MLLFQADSSDLIWFHNVWFNFSRAWLLRRATGARGCLSLWLKYFISSNIILLLCLRPQIH